MAKHLLITGLIGHLMHCLRATISYIRIVRLRLRGIRLGRNRWTKPIDSPKNTWDIVLDDMVALDHEVVLSRPRARKVKHRILIGSSAYALSRPD